MTATSIERSVRGLSWSTLLRLAGAGQSLGLAVAAIVLGDAEAGLIAVATIVVLVVQRFRATAGAILLALVFADTAFFTFAAALSNLVDRAAPPATIAPAALAAIGLTGLAAAIANVGKRSLARTPSRVASVTAVVIAAALATVAILSLSSARGAAASGAGVLHLEIRGARFSTDSLSATSQKVTVAVTNHDLFWHTFTIPELGIDLRVPLGDEKSVTFDAPPGSYTYICGIPGHASFMRGTLTVR